MKLVKLSNMAGFDKEKPEGYLRMADNDLINLALAMQGRIRLGSGIDGERGENISGEFQVFTCGAAGLTSVVTHTLGASPIGFLLINKSGLGDIAMSTTSNTLVTFTTLATANTTYTVFLLK